MAVVRSPISHWDFFGFRYFEDVQEHIELIMLIILIIHVTKANMDSWREKSPIVDLIQQNLGGIIGSFEEGTFAVTSKED